MAGTYYDNNWCVGGKSRGTRSQFRLEGLQPFKCTYPVHLTDMMDAGQSTQTGFQKSDFATSPFKENRTRAVREYEQTIDQLRKENFDLKLKIFLTEEENRKRYNSKTDSCDDTDNTVQIIVNLRVETENLRQELSNKNEELQNALEQAEKYASELKEAQEKLEQQQDIVAVLEQFPSSEEFKEMKDQYSDLINQNEYLTKLLAEKDKEIEETNVKLEELVSLNATLEEKIKKRNLAIKGCALKYYKDVENIPKCIRSIVRTAVEAAQNNNEADLTIALDNFKTSICEIMPESSNALSAALHSNKSMGDSLGQGSSKDVHKSSSCHNLSEEQRSRELQSSGVSFVPCDPELSPSNNTSRSVTKSSSQLSVGSQNSEKTSENGSVGDNFESIMEIINENDNLKLDVQEKSKIISNLTSTCSELEKEMQELKFKLEEAYAKLKMMEVKSEEGKSQDMDSFSKQNSTAQTDIQWYTLQAKISDKEVYGFGNSEHIGDLKEEILTLLLAIEQKDQELCDTKQKLVSLEDDLESNLNRKETTLTNIEEDFSSEREELLQRLAVSYSVNNELLKHLQSLERFMEELLHQKNLSTSSIENINETTDFFSQLSKCLDESLKLSHVLSDKLSICDGSKIFDPSDASVNREEFSVSDSRSYGQMFDSRLIQNDSDFITTSQEGMNNFHFLSKDSNKNSVRTGKRKSSFSTLQKSVADTILADPDNVVVLKTSNNEDLILLLNDRGDPEDVLIRNNHNFLDKCADGDQLRRRCWDTSMSGNFLNSEKFSLPQYTEHTYNTTHINSLKSSYMRCNTWMSSDSDTWSEPDRNISMQRIGIDVQSSPATSKSPRRSRFRDRKLADDASSSKNESASSYVKPHSWLKRRKSSETPKMPFVCKKCLKQSQQADVPVKDDSPNIIEIQELYNKNVNQQKEAESLLRMLEDKKILIESLNKEKQELANSVNHLKNEIAELKIRNDTLSLENSESSNQLIKSNESCNALKEINIALEKKLSDSNSICLELKSELSETKDRLLKLDSKCSEYEDNLSTTLKCKEEYEEKFKFLQLREAKLLEDIKELMSQRGSLLEQLRSEEEHKNLVENENLTLSKRLKESFERNSELQASNDELRKVKEILSKEKASLETDLVSKNSVCENLNDQMTTLQETLESLKCKCASYEKEILQFSNTKQNIIEQVLTFENAFSSNLNTLISLCGKTLDLEKESFKDSSNGFATFSQDLNKQIDNLINKITLKNLHFSNIVEDFAQQLQHYHKILQESKSNYEEEKHKTAVIEQKYELKEKEIESFKEKNLQLQNCVEELQNGLKKCNSMNETHRLKSLSIMNELKEREVEIQTFKETNVTLQKNIETLQNQIVDSEKSLTEFKNKNASSQEQLVLLEEIIEKNKNLLNSKEEEITKLQKRIFMLQTQVNKLFDTKINSTDYSSSKIVESVSKESRNDDNDTMNVSLNSLLQYTLKSNSSDESNETPLVSIVSEKSHQSKFDQGPEKDCSKYLKKIRSMQAKIEIYEKRIEILEKEKSTLRENLLSSYVPGHKRVSNSLPDTNIADEKLAELEAKLDIKQSFIKELKADLYKAHDSLIDKQKDNDKLQRELLKYKKIAEENTRFKLGNTSGSRLSDPLHQQAETNVKDLRKQKKELINSLLDLQKQFYEAKNIHLKHFENFSKHIENLRSLQTSWTLYKSESAPLLNKSLPSQLEQSLKWDKTLKNMQIDLEIDIECLQSFKIFLKRFFTPIMLEKCQVSKLKPEKDSSSGSSGLQTGQNVDIGIQTVLPLEKNSEIKDVDKSSDSVEQLCLADSSNDRLITTAFSISLKLDWVESTLKNVIELFHHISETHFDIMETPRKTAAKSILQKLYESLHILQEKADEVFYLNSALKSLELFDSNIPQNTNRHDMSDRESILSEETITLSRSESLSPVSFDEPFPSQSSQQGRNGKDHTDHHHHKHSDVNKSASLRSSHKLISSSQDSVFQRSHYSSPDLGIESDPNHEHSAPEQTKQFHMTKESITSRHDLSGRKVQKNFEAQRISSIYSFSDCSMRLKDESLPFTIGNSPLHAIGILQEYELLKKEVAESLVGIKSVLSRTGDGLQKIKSYTSPRKNLEYTTFKAIKDTCANIEACLEKAHKLVLNFWIAPCPSDEELKLFLQQNEELNAKLKRLYESKKKQEKDFRDVLERLKQAEIIKEKQEYKISKKLVKTKKVLRQAEKLILENKNTELPLLAKHNLIKKS